MQRETIIIPPRYKEVVKRQLLMYYGKALDRIKKQIDTTKKRQYMAHRVQNEHVYLFSNDISSFSVVFHAEIDQFHDDYCEKNSEDSDEDVELITLEDDCECYKGVSVQVELRYRPIVGKRITLLSTTISGQEDRFSDGKAPSLESVIAVVDSWEDFRLCQCGEVTEDPDRMWCRDCFVYRYTRTEDEGGDCCVCHENEGRWVELPCGHQVHQHCYFSIKREERNGCPIGDMYKDHTRKCPLCRRLTTNSDVVINPFDKYDK